MDDRRRDVSAAERAARTYGEHSYGEDAGRANAAEFGFLAGVAWAARFEEERVPGEAVDATAQTHPVGTAFIGLKLTDTSLGDVRDQIEMAIGDGVRRALAKIELGLDDRR